MISLRKYDGKMLVSTLRKTDLAHAGEEEAIDLVMSHFKKEKHFEILDVGCGLGGTAQYLLDKKWGNISGLDIEIESISYAKEHYPKISFYQCDIADSTDTITSKYDILTLFNVFYAFNDQRKALKTMCDLTKKDGTLCIFDYSNPLIKQKSPLFRQGDNKTTPFIPIDLDNSDNMLKDAGWQKEKVLDISQKYMEWYTNLINLLTAEKAKISSLFSDSSFDTALTTYSRIRDSIKNGELGGVIIYARKV